MNNTIYKRFLKRLLDIALSLLFFLLFWWLYVIIAIMVRLKLGSPILFRQERPGMNEKPFDMIKFRTMTDDRDENGRLLPDNVRLTRFGQFLRSTSLDELPEIFLILNGKMSIVGPRPLLMRYLPRYNEHQARRHEVRPGLTGYAQAYGRNSLSWEEKFEKDVYYVDHVSLLLDIKILIKTVTEVLKREGISSATSETMEEFFGTQTTGSSDAH